MAYFVGIDIGGTSTDAVLLDDSGTARLRPKGEGWHLPDGPEQRERDERFTEADPLRSNAWLYGHDVEGELTEGAGRVAL